MITNGTLDMTALPVFNFGMKLPDRLGWLNPTLLRSSTGMVKKAFQAGMDRLNGHTRKLLYGSFVGLAGWLLLSHLDAILWIRGHDIWAKATEQSHADRITMVNERLNTAEANVLDKVESQFNADKEWRGMKMEWDRENWTEQRKFNDAALRLLEKVDEKLDDVRERIPRKENP